MHDETIPWPHAPLHRLSESGTYFVTAATYEKQHFFRSADRLAVLQRGLLKLSHEYGWRLEAWAIFSNHYHFVGHSPSDKADATSLVTMLSDLHTKTAVWLNRVDREEGRRVWFNYRDTQLTFEKSYLARLNYVHHNAVKHGLVAVANQYPWCSAGWFERTAPRAQIRTIYRFRWEAVKIDDEFEVDADW